MRKSTRSQTASKNSKGAAQKQTRCDIEGSTNNVRVYDKTLSVAKHRVVENKKYNETYLMGILFRNKKTGEKMAMSMYDFFASDMEQIERDYDRIDFVSLEEAL